MVAYLKDKIVDKTVNTAAIGNDKVLVYKTATSTFVFEAQSAVGAINDLTDVTISGVPADNEVLAYDTGTSEWINQTAAEAGLATVAGLAAYYPLAGATLTGNLNMGDFLIDDVDDIQAYDTSGIAVRDSAAASKIVLATTTYAFTANATGNMGSQNLINVLDPTSAQHASTKNYDDTHLFTKEAVTAFTDGYIPVYRTASGKFEMEEQSAALGLPVADTTNLVKGSADGTKLMRFEVDGLTTGTTRVMTVPDKDITLCDVDEVLKNPASEALDLANFDIYGTGVIKAYDGGGIELHNSAGANRITIATTSYAFTALANASMNTYQLWQLGAGTDSHHAIRKDQALLLDGTQAMAGNLDINDNIIVDMKNSAASALSGTQKDIEIDIGGTPYYFTVYPTKA